MSFFSFQVVEIQIPLIKEKSEVEKLLLIRIKSAGGESLLTVIKWKSLGNISFFLSFFFF